MAKPSTKLARPVYIVDGCRTPFLKTASVPNPFQASDLAVLAGNSLLIRYGFSPEQLDEVIFGCVMPEVNEANIARIVALRLGCGNKVPAWTVQRNCASGLQAIDSAVTNIANGRSDLILAGGTEAMSHAPVLLNPKLVIWLGQLMQKRHTLEKLSHSLQFPLTQLAPVIGILKGLTDPIAGLSMGQTAEQLAYQFNISREQMDAYAHNSHQRVIAAQKQDYFQEIVPIYDKKGKYYHQDTGVRADSSTAKLAKLRPLFDRKVGKVTAGNSSQITDGACCLLLASEPAVKQHQLPVLGRVVEAQWAGLAPDIMGLGPVHAMTPLLQKHGLTLDDIDYWEINEAFAAQVLACKEVWLDQNYCQQQLGLNHMMGEIPNERLNIDGGAISMGHPVGASGARIVLHLLHILQRTQSKRGIASLCIGGGQGGALLLARD